MIVCLPVKNGWQLPQTSTRSSGRVEPTVHSVPHEPQWTLASKYLGWISGFTRFSSVAVRAGQWPSRWSPVSPGSGARGGRLDRLDPDALLALGGVLELHLAGDRREHGVIVAESGPRTGQERHAALADDDRACRDQLTVPDLHAEALADAVAAILDAAAGLLVCHLVYSSFFVARGFFAVSAGASSPSASAFTAGFFGAAFLTGASDAASRSAFAAFVVAGAVASVASVSGSASTSVTASALAFGAALGLAALTGFASAPTASFA